MRLASNCRDKLFCHNFFFSKTLLFTVHFFSFYHCFLICEHCHSFFDKLSHFFFLKILADTARKQKYLLQNYNTKRNYLRQKLHSWNMMETLNPFSSLHFNKTRIRFTWDILTALEFFRFKDFKKMRIQMNLLGFAIFFLRFYLEKKKIPFIKIVLLHSTSLDHFYLIVSHHSPKFLSSPYMSRDDL